MYRNQYIHAFHTKTAPLDNALMHQYESQLARTIAALAERKESYKAGRKNLALMKEDGTVNQNKLAEAMAHAGYRLSQPTLTRILNSKEDKDRDPKTIRLLAGFFGVDASRFTTEVQNSDAVELSQEARLLAKSFDEMPLSLRQFFTDIRDAWVRLKDGDPFLAEQILDEIKSA